MSDGLPGEPHLIPNIVVGVEERKAVEYGVVLTRSDGLVSARQQEVVVRK